MAERRICDAYREGTTVRAICAAEGITSSVAYHVLYKHGVELRVVEPLSVDTVALIRFERARRMTIKALAAHFGLSPTTIFRIVGRKDKPHAVD